MKKPERTSVVAASNFALQLKAVLLLLDQKSYHICVVCPLLIGYFECNGHKVISALTVSMTPSLLLSICDAILSRFLAVIELQSECKKENFNPGASCPQGQREKEDDSGVNLQSQTHVHITNPVI